MFSAFIKNTNVGSGMKSGGATLLLLILFTVFLSHGPHEKLQPAALAAAITGCDGCHGKPPVDNVSRTGETTGQFAGSHNKHTRVAGSQGYEMACSRCHYTYAEVAANYKHSNGFINISSADVKGNSYSLGKNKPVSNSPSFGSCTNVYCHSKKVSNARVYVPKQWTTTMAADCTGCHGNDKASALPMTANAHKSHVNNTNGRFAGLSIKCIQCHASTVTGDNRTLQPGAYGVAGVHANGTATVAWGSVNAGQNAYNSGVSCAWSNPTGGTYCHSSAAGTAAPNVDPGTWNAVADSAQANSSCVYCHNGTVADAPFTQSTNKHSLHLNVIAGNIPNNEFSCSRCHAYTMRPDNSIFTNSTSLHINRVKDVRFRTPFSNRTGSYIPNTCSNTYCHGGGVSGSWTTGTARNCGSCHAGARNNPIRWSPPHNRHYSSVTLSTWANGWRGENRSIPSTTQFSCGVCHNVKGSHVSGPPAADFGDAQLVFNLYTAWGPRATSRPSAATKSSATLTANPRAFYYSPETSCAVYCHSNGRNNFIPRNVKWTAGTVGCGTGACHQIGGVQYNWSSAHTKHVDTYIRGGNTWIKCNSCHTGTVNTSGVIINRQRHVNGYANVSSATINVGGTNTTFIYVPGTQTCTSNNYCHSNGRGTTAARRYTNVLWTAPSSTCTSCHGGKSGGVMVGSASGFMLSSSHRKHLNASASWDCSICHYKTAASALALKTYSGVKYHVDGSRNVILSNTFGSFTSYKGTFQCENTACHGGKTRNPWSTPNINHICTKCHGVNPTSAALANSGDNRKFFAPGWNTTGTDTDGTSVATDIQVGAHFVHLSSVYIKKIKCNECHLVPTTVTAGGHIEAKRFNSTTISFTQASTATITIGVGAAATPTILGSFTGYTSGTPIKAATCSSVYCHGNRLKNSVTSGTYRKPSWNLDLTATPPTATSCARCHGFPPTDASLHGAGDTTCNLCHPHVSSGVSPTTFVNKALHINGKVESTSDCLGCHGSSKTKTLGTAGTIRQVVGAGGDFVRLSRHVSNGTSTAIVTKWDCVICHMEGDTTTADRVTGVHNDASGLVNLRNVDSPASGYTINNKSMNETMRTDMDTFCLGCHDSNGASGITVNATNTGLTTSSVTRNLTPWNTNDNLKNGRDSITTLQRTRVVDVKTQFYAGTYTWNGSSSAMPAGFTSTNYNGNPSQHAVLGPRYFTNHASWTSVAWTPSHTLRNGQVMNSIREKARLHCSDCHLSESNAHGSANAWYMLLNGTANDYTSDTAQTGTAANSAGNTCLKCHASFYAGSANAVSRWNHSLDSSRTASAWGEFTYLGSNCTLCHGGNNAVGTIHGTNNTTETYTNTVGTFTRYRFLPGTWMRAQPGGGTNDATAWTGTGTGNCYFGGSASGDAETMSNCGSHAGTGSKTGTATPYGRATKY